VVILVVNPCLFLLSLGVSLKHFSVKEPFL